MLTNLFKEEALDLRGNFKYDSMYKIRKFKFLLIMNICYVTNATVVVIAMVIIYKWTSITTPPKMPHVFHYEAA